MVLFRYLWCALFATVFLDITDRKQAEEQIQRQARLLEGINRIFHEAITSDSEEKLGRVCLSVAQELTGSKIGFVGEIRTDGRLYDITVSNPGWDLCRIDDKAGHSGSLGAFKIHGLYGHVLEHGRSLLTNDPASHPDSIGLPKGHPPLTAFLGVPLIENGKTIGLVAVGNREGGYSLEQQQTLEALAPAIIQALLRKRAEDEVCKSRDELEVRITERTVDLQRQARLINLSPDAILVRDLDGTITFWSTGATALYGWSSEEAVGRNSRELLKSQRPGSPGQIMDTVMSGGRWEGELHQKRKDGTDVIVSSRLILQRNQDGRPTAVLQTHSDITEKKRLEEQLRHSQKMEAIGTLAGGIAHDFNNVLAAIIGFTEMVVDDVSDNEHARQKMERVLTAALRGRDLIKQILAFSRKTEGERKQISLTPLVAETHALLRASLPSTIEINVATTTGDDYVVANSTQMQQVLMNLATNAAQAMHEGGRLTIGVSSVTLSAGSVLPDPDMEPGTYVRLMVKDTGVGMSEEVRQRIFEPFFTTKEPGKGTGMGLAAVWGIVKSHGGAVTVQSEAGKGSTFEVYLPRVQKPEVTKESETALELPTGTERILFVDDEELLVEMARGLLESLGYHVTVAANGSAAWNLFLEDPSRFDLIITDQTMPDITGVTLAQKMLRVRESLPIILCTGYSEKVSAEKAKEVGIAAFVMKPVMRKEMAETVRRVLDAQSS